MTVYYAQQSSVNINAANVWNTASNGSGSYLTWPPATNDVLMANGKTAITINVNTTVAEARTDTANGATNGGGFILADGVTLTANCYSGSTDCVAFSNVAPAVGYVVGNCQGGSSSNADGVINTASGTLYVTGNVTGGSAGAAMGAHNASTGMLSITGSAIGGTSTNSSGAYASSTGTLSVSGACTATTSPAISATSVLSTILLGGPFIGSASGISAIFSPTWRWLSTAGATYMSVQTSDLTETRSLYTADSVGGNPSAANVRYGTTYGPANELTGTAYIPAAASVLYGVPVDATTGTVTITASDIRDAIGLASANLDTQLAAIPTTGLTAQQVWEYVTRTLTAGGGITAQDVWEYATREITGGTVDTLTNSPDVPTEAEIAAQVRVELTPELARVANCATVESTGDQLAGLL